MRNNEIEKGIKIVPAISVFCFVFMTIALSGIAFAHGTEKHVKLTSEDQLMKKLHGMMSMFAQGSAKLEGALDKGDAATVALQCDMILKELPDLKKCRPHKNVKERKHFVQLATKLEESVKTTENLAQKGDFTGGQAAFKKVEEMCATCHAKFRD